MHRGGLPFHVPPLRSSEGKDAVLGKDVETERVNTLLVDDNKVLLLLLAVDCLVTDHVLELHDFGDFGIYELALRFHQLFSLF